MMCKTLGEKKRWNIFQTYTRVSSPLVLPGTMQFVHLFVKMRTKVYDGEEEKQKNQNKNKCMVRFTTVKWSQTTWINLRGRVLAAIFFQTFPIIPFRKRHQKVPYMPYIDSWGPLSTSPSLTKQQQRQKATEWKFLEIRFFRV